LNSSRKLTLLAGVLLSAAAAAADAPVSVLKITPEDYRNQSQIKLSDGTNLVVPLVRVKLIAILHTPEGKPQLLLSGKRCTECDQHIGVYLVPGNYRQGTLRPAPYPGTLRSYESGELAQMARLFYGQCIEDHRDAVVWFVSAVGDDGEWHGSRALRQVSDDANEAAELATTPATLATVLNRVEDGVCHELPGIDGTTEH